MPIALRADFDAAKLRGFAKRTKDGPQARRLLALAAIYDGASRTEAARIGGVTLQIVRDWVVKFNTHGPDGLIDRKAPGQPSKLNHSHRQAIAKAIESGPIASVHGVVRWRLVDLCQWIFEEYSRLADLFGQFSGCIRFSKLHRRRLNELMRLINASCNPEPWQ